jgi:predicted dienelactone hydrolase
MTPPRRAAAALLAVATLALHPAAEARARVTADSLAAPGRFAVGVATLTLVDPSRPTAASGPFPGSAVRTLPTDVYYPTAGGTPGEITRDTPLDASDGPYPLLVFAHGLGGARTNFAATLAHLASRGHLVVAPDFPLTNLATIAAGTTSLADLVNQPGDVSFEVDTFTGTGAAAGTPFAAAVDRDAIGVFGHSFGGGTTLLAVFGGPLADPRLDAAAALAPFTCPFGPDMFGRPAPPVLVLQGTSDAIVDAAWSRDVYPLIPAPKRLIEIVGGDHLGFMSDPALGRIRDSDILALFTGPLLEGLPGGPMAQFAALGAALAAVPGADADRCQARPMFPDPSTLGDPLLALDEQRRITEVALTAFFEAHLRGDRAAKRFLAGFRRRGRFGKAVRACGARPCRFLRTP